MEWIRAGELKAIRIGRIVLIPASEIDRLLSEQK
jgi:excisionase family DNA binding protein